MRMRKKVNLEPRMEKCAHVLIKTPEDNKGTWKSQFSAFPKLFLEIGCGKGTFTAETASNNKDAMLVAVEKVPNAMVMAMEKAVDRNLENVRYIDMDALQILDVFAPGEVDRIYVNFCDPWPKSHDAKHRLTAPGFLRKYATALSDGGQIHFKTDNDPLFAWSLEQFELEGWELSEVTNNLHENGPCGVMTDYEAKFYAEGITINRLVATKVEKTKSTKDGDAPRMYNAGIARPYRTSELFRGVNSAEEKE